MAKLLCAVLLFVTPTLAQTYTLPMQTNESGYVQVPCKIDGVSVPLRCVIDTGAVQTAVSSTILRPTKDDRKEQLFGATNQSIVPTRKVVFSVADKKFRGVCFLIIVDPRQEFDVLLGRDFLSIFSRVSFDFKNHVVILESSSS
jgi:hypothetical protein